MRRLIRRFAMGAGCRTARKSGVTAITEIRFSGSAVVAPGSRHVGGENMLRQFVLIASRGNKAQPNLNEGTEVCAAQTKFGNRVPRWHSLSECKSSFRRPASGGWSASYVEPHIA